MIKVLDNTKNNKNLITEFLKLMDSYFEPNLHKRLFTKSDVQTFQDYAKKILTYASCIGLKEDDELKGLLVIYHNDAIHKMAYIPLLGVLPSYSGQGLASAFIEKAIKLSKTSGMKQVFVNTWSSNQKAVDLYKKNGFEIYETSGYDIKLQHNLIE